MRRILVTGANKGIGFAIAKGILKQHEDTFVFLGSRDPSRGEQAVASLTAEEPAWGDRVRLTEIDVSDAASVTSAAHAVERSLGEGETLYGLVNNAGVGFGHDMKTVLEVNTKGMHRVTEACLPLLDGERGRIVQVTSAAGPNFVADCSPERQRFFLSPDTEWDDLQGLMDECLAMEGDDAAFAQKGLGKSNAYGLSKALANTYTLQLARRYPNLHINACTPGFIETDLTRALAESRGRSPAELGMKSPEEGARAPLFLLFGELEGNGRYYGSDAERSPLHRYRAPGSPPYTGE